MRLFGLLGPNGPLPMHITEYVRHRLRHAGDPTLSRFLDLFHHRFLALFYRAWAQAQPHVNRDRPGQDRFRVYVGAFVGVAPPPLRDRDAVPDLAKLFHAGTLVRQVRNAEGLAAIIRQFFRVPVGDRGVRRPLAGPGAGASARTCAATARALGARCGRRAPASGTIRASSAFTSGPLTLAQYEAFLPAARAGSGAKGGGALLRKLVDWVRFYLCFELDWDVRLRLKRDEVPRAEAGHARPTWLDDVAGHASVAGRRRRPVPGWRNVR